jgi:hypothetical protein
MKTALRLARIVPLLAALAPSIVRAQTGTQDQLSPTTAVPPVQTASFSIHFASDAYQAQVQAGLAGRLEGFTLQLSGNQGAGVMTSIRLGPGWNTSPAVFQSAVVLASTGINDVFVDVTSANIMVAPGTLFVIEIGGQNVDCAIEGTYLPPGAGTPPYSEPIFWDGPGCFVDCGYHLAFTTFVLTNSGTAFCFGDGSSTTCPCGNAGAIGNGCASSVNPAGARLAATGVPSIAQDTLTVTGTGMPNSSALYFQGTTQTNGGLGSVFGDGLRCAGGSIVRLKSKLNAGGSSAYPTGSDQPISLRGGDSAGDVRTYQCWYRNAAAFCTSSTFNLTNGIQTVWIP